MSNNIASRVFRYSYSVNNIIINN